MVSAVKLNKVIIPLIALLTLQGINLPGAIAASSSAKPKPKVSLVKKNSKIEKKTVAQKHPHRVPVHKAALPAASLVWPPLGFRSAGTAFARVPTGVELIGILSTMKNSSTATNSCAADPKKPNTRAFSCAAILVGSTLRCNWWKISSTITGIDPANPPGRISLGDFSDTVSAAAAKTIQTIIMVSPVPLAPGIKFSALHAFCGIGPSADIVPSSTFIPTPVQSPEPTESATPIETPSPANT